MPHPVSLIYSSMASTQEPPRMASVKALAESGLTSIPSSYTFSKNQHDYQSASDPEPEDHIPIIDFSHLASSSPDQRSKAIHDLGEACKNWGFFKVINHGIPESLTKEMIDVCESFFNLTEEEKREFEGKPVLDPIRYGTSFNASVEKAFFWRDFLKVFVHPQFHSPNKPSGFSETSSEYCKRTRQVARELLKGISESLGLEASYINRALNMELCVQLLVANFYPPCPEPDLAMGMPPHSDYGLLTLLAHNGVAGLQVQHNGNWVNVNAIPNSLLVNVGDHLEILSNGKYKSVQHRAVVNNKSRRISLVTVHGPSLDAMVSPVQELIDNEGCPPRYIGLKHKEYFQLFESNQLDTKLTLDRIRI